jgi:DNA-3-methyladenine glycosylase I
MNDVDGRIRCPWATSATGPDRALMQNYHDSEWGRPLRGQVAMFERMTLEAFQSGLSWLIILRKRENFRNAFAGFDLETVARFTEQDVARLMADAGIVRNRAKIEATIANARAATDSGVDLTELLWSFVALARDLKRRGFRFVGPTTAYALMQATGMVDDHLRDCWVPGSVTPLAVNKGQ